MIGRGQKHLQNRTNRRFSELKRRSRRLLSIGVSALLSISTFLTVIPQTETTVYAAGTEKKLHLGHAVIGKDVTWSSAAKVYFGSKGDPLAWRVIGYNGEGVASSADTATLLASDNISTSKFDDTDTSNIYSGSTLQTAVNTIYTDRFNSYEGSIILPRTLQTGSYSGSAPYTDGVATTAVSNAKLWPLSTYEAYFTNRYLRIASNHWWLRSPGEGYRDAAYVDRNGSFLNFQGMNVEPDSPNGVRPAFNLNLPSIILTSAAEGGKIPGSSVGTLNEVASYTGNEWKLTLLDSARSSFTASVPTTAVTTVTEGYQNWPISVSYSNAQTGTNEHVSAILTDSEGTALYYGYIATNSESSTDTTVTIPTGLSTGTYKLKVFNEQVNGTDGNYATDLSSELIEVATLIVQGKVAAPTFDPVAGTYTGTRNVTLSSNTSGAEIYYTTGSADPTTSSTRYTSPIPVSESITIKAIAVKTGMTNSDVSTAGYTINAAPVPVTGVTVSPKEVELKPGSTKKLTAAVKPDDATNRRVKWSSNKESVAKVDENEGLVTAIAEGEAIITATTVDGGKKDTCKVIVKKDAPVVEECRITFDPNGGKGEMAPQVVDKGETVKLGTNDFTRSGYEFKNWNTKADGSGDKYDNKESIKLEKDLTLYAQWKEKHDDDDDDDDHEEEPAPKNDGRYPDGFDELRASLSSAISAAIASGKAQIVYWNKGTALPADVMKTLHDNPNVTLVFSYTYLGVPITLTIPGSAVVLNPAVEWYGPAYLYGLYGKGKTAVLTTNATASTGTYTIKPGDTLSGIAKRFKTTVKHLQEANNIKDADKIKPRMVLKY